jgi:DNA-binding winged helix-turn-helix (wHTH) protein
VASSRTSETVTFAEFEANLRARELRRHGTRVKLPDQPFQVLAMLLEHPGELVTREEFRDRLWPGDTFVDFDHGLNNAVNRLREAIGDSADSPRFVETLPRRGYRFIAQMERGMCKLPPFPNPRGQKSRQIQTPSRLPRSSQENGLKREAIDG